jgi:hypothetical protein
MAIGNAVQRDPFIYIYNEQGQQTAALSMGSEPNDGLCGYTSSSVNVRKGPFIYSYDENGSQINVVNA